MNLEVLWIDSAPTATLYERTVIRTKGVDIGEIHYGFEIDNQLEGEYDLIVLNPWFLYGATSKKESHKDMPETKINPYALGLWVLEKIRGTVNRIIPVYLTLSPTRPKTKLEFNISNNRVLLRIVDLAKIPQGGLVEMIEQDLTK